MSTECENDRHADCNAPPDGCNCGCHAAITAAMERSLGTVTRLDVSDLPDHGDGGASNWEADRRQRSFYAPDGGGGDMYCPTGPQSAFEQLGLLPHEISDAEDEQASRSIAAMRLRRLFSDTYQRAGLPVPQTFRVPRRQRGWWAALLGAVRLSR